MANQGYSRLVNDPTSSDTFVSATLQQQDVGEYLEINCESFNVRIEF